MNKISDKKVFEILNNSFDILIKKYSTYRVLGVFAQGNVNYGFASDETDFNLIGVYLPSFNELCTELPMTWDFNGITMYDIRTFYTAAHNTHDTSLELLFAYSKINPIYEKVFYDNLIKRRDIIGHYNVKLRVIKAHERAINSINLGNYFEACRLLASVELYLKDTPLEECFYITNEYLQNYLWRVKNNEITFEKEEKIKQINKDFEFFKSITSKSIDAQADMLLKKGIIALLGKALKFSIANESFMDNLTELERTALSIITSNLDEDLCGNISISKLVAASGISRPVYKNVLTKLTECNVAEVANQGVKGTYISFYDKNLLLDK